MIQFDEEKRDDRIDELRKREEEELVKMLSGKYGISYADLSAVPIEGDALHLIPESKAREAGLAPFQATGKKILVAVLSPEKKETVAAINELQSRGFIPFLYMVSKGSMERAWNRYKEMSGSFETKAGILDISTEFLDKISGTIKNIRDIRETVEDVIRKNEGHKISSMFEIILAGAIAVDASDVHIEPEEAQVKIRFRLDGVLEAIMAIDFETYKLLNSRVKLIAGLKLNVKDSAQDGRFSIKLSGTEIEIRVSVLPGAYGESIVLRLLNPNAISVPFEELGIDKRLLEVIEREIRKPNGIILTTGPTGSGKTTTLYAILKKIYDPGTKVITIEDPIEYHLTGITQTQVEEDKGYTFASGLRSVLRQDPDVIMVGEIRDPETATTAINAALTGHLVFSTLHTNNAAGTIPRLIDLGINPKIISSALNISLAQRLVRKLCESCKKEDVPNEKEALVISSILERIKNENKLDALLEVSGNKDGKKLWRAEGCAECNGTGYRGRVGVHEGILTDENIEKIINENPSEREIKKAAESQGLLDLAEDGIVKVLKGITSLEELERVVEVTQNKN
ncbi:MAG: GspE/PulE family protein [Candidatus Paceibacterota bacterium]|jgi:type IV pilus assembly protein PilB